MLEITAVILAFFAKGMTGFANTLVFSSIMSFQKASLEITPLDLILGFPANLIMTIKNRKGIVLKQVLPLFGVIVVGMIPGVLLLKNTNPYILKIALGVIIIILAVEMFTRENSKVHKETPKAMLYVIGIFSGLVCGIFGIGAFFTAYMSRTTKDIAAFKGNLCAVFLLESLVRIPLYIFSGVITLNIFTHALTLLPFMAIGLVAGLFLSSRINEKLVKKVICVMLMFTGISLIINNVASIL